MACRLAIAKATMAAAAGSVTIAKSSRRTIPKPCRRFETHASRRRPVEPLAHFLAGLEERHGFLVDRHMGAGTRIAPIAGRPALHRERPEAAQLHPVAACQGGNDLAQDRIDD